MNSDGATATATGGGGNGGGASDVGSGSHDGTPPKTTTTATATRSKMNYACEACRLAKVKCQPGAAADSGICKRCSEFKRECVFRTGPRTRRSKYSQASTSTPLPPPPGPSKTFSINFDMPAEEKPDSEFDFLREMHERTLSALYVSDEEEDGKSFHDGSMHVMPPNQGPAGAATFSFNDMSTIPPKSEARSSSISTSRAAPAAPSVKLQPMGNLAIKPQFNLESATKLLECFRGMLVQCPVFVLPKEADVRSMAREYPFVLLAILAVTSCTTSLQGYSLYDEEFRKILGLKFVAGGERSLELLQGLLIYCGWYPFHLRPKNKHGLQYLRMTVDLVHDLELDQEDGMQIAAEDKLASIRAFLGCSYIEATSANAWNKTPSLGHSQWLAKCCNILEQSSDLYQDHVLVWLARLQQVNSEVYTQVCSYKEYTGPQDNYQRELMRLGLVARLREWQNTIPSQYSAATSVVLCSLYSDVYVVAAAIMRAPKPAMKAQQNPPISPTELLGTTHTIRTFFDFVVTLTTQELSTLSSADITRIILMLIMATRISFPLPANCPDLDYWQARDIMKLDEYLEKLSAGSDDGSMAGSNSTTGMSDEDRSERAGGLASGDNRQNSGSNSSRGKSKTDVATALRVVIASLRKTYASKIASHKASQAAAAAAAAAARGGGQARMTCPMIDGTLDGYISNWEGDPDQQHHARYYQGHQQFSQQQHYHQHNQQQHHPQQQHQQQPPPGSNHAAFLPGSTSLSSLSSGYATSPSSHSSMIGGMPMTTTTPDSSSAGPSAILGSGGSPCGDVGGGPTIIIGNNNGNNHNIGMAAITGTTQSPVPGSTQHQHQQQPVVFNDLWDAMTMGWTDANIVDVVGGVVLPAPPHHHQQQHHHSPHLQQQHDSRRVGRSGSSISGSDISGNGGAGGHNNYMNMSVMYM